MERTWRRSIWNLIGQRQSTEVIVDNSKNEHVSNLGQRESTNLDYSPNGDVANSGRLMNMASALRRSLSNIAGNFTWRSDSVSMALDPTDDSSMQSETFSIKETQSQIARNSQYIRNLKEGNDTIEVKFDDSKTSMTISYPKQMSVQLKKDVENMLKGVCTIPLKLEDGKTNLLERDPVIVYIEDELESQEINCQIVTENVDNKYVPVIVAENKALGKKGEKVIKACLVQRKFKKSNVSRNRLSALMASLNKKHGKKILIRSSAESLLVYCTSDIEEDIALEIEQELNAKFVREEVTIELQRYKYIDTYLKEELHDVASSFDVGIEFALEIGSERGRIILSGVHNDVHRMNKRLESKIDATHTHETVISDTGCCNFLRDNASDVCKELERIANCIVDVKLVDDCYSNDGLEARLAGKTFRLRLTQNTSAQIVVQMIRPKDSPVNARNRILPDILQKANTSGKLEHLPIPFEHGSLQKKTFEENVFALLRKVELKETSNMAVQLESGFNETDELIFRELLNSFLLFFREQSSSLQKVTFHLENDEYKLDQLKKIITGIATLEHHQDNNDEYVVKLTGRKAKVQGLNVLHEIQDLKLKIDQLKRMQVCVNKGRVSLSRIQSQGSEMSQRECDADSGVFHLMAQENRSSTVDVAETILISSSPSIGLIHIDLPNNEEINGTCFRVGTKFIITTLHTLSAKLDLLKQKHNKAFLKGRQWKQKIFDKDVYVIFAYKKVANRDQLFKHRLQCRPAYVNDVLDVAIMELKTDKAQLPKPLVLARQCYVPKTMTFIHHSKGNVQILDPACNIVDVNDSCLKDAIRYATSNYPQYGEGYRDISSRNFFLCHSSAEPGASGAPGMISDLSFCEESVVFCFMSEGTPSFFPRLSQEEQLRYPKDLMFEKAVRMDAVHDVLYRDDRTLCHELFPRIVRHDSMEF